MILSKPYNIYNLNTDCSYNCSTILSLVMIYNVPTFIQYVDWGKTGNNGREPSPHVLISIDKIKKSVAKTHFDYDKGCKQMGGSKHC